ncbi:MAG: peptidase S41 [Proteobacteria bacterium]|nr:MAG: peptidase S41 [Pseudomonadota bacterium]
MEPNRIFGRVGCDPGDADGVRKVLMRQGSSFKIPLVLAGIWLVTLAYGGQAHPLGGDDDGAVRVASAAERGGGARGVADDDDDDEPKDYWAPIPFDRTNFEEVRQQVKKRYIDPVDAESWAYAQAASWAVSSHDEDNRLLLPESFYRERRDDPNEKGLLKGEVTKLHPGDPFVILGESEVKEEDDKRRLSDDEIRALRKRQQDRSRALKQAWLATDFSAKDFDRVMGFIKREFEPAGDWTYKKAWVAAAQGYLYSLDPHSSLVAKSAWEDSTRKTTDSSFDGIGAILTKRPDSDYTLVESPIQGQPAVKAGLRAGDQIIEVDGKDIKGESLSKVVSRIRGERGTAVKLKLLREGHPAAIEISIVRARIAIKNVSGFLVDHHTDVGYIKVTGFVRTTDIELERVYRELEAKTQSGHLRGLILDLRNNSGGRLNQGIRVSDRFIGDGLIVSVKNRNTREDEMYRATTTGSWDVPMVVLVNDGTASAAEIVASAIQDNKRGIVIGDRTFGKASVQTLYSPILQDDYYIKLTVARYYSPSGRTVQVMGVRPDIEVTPEIDGVMPLGFREENLSGHLAPLDFDYRSANHHAARRAEACVASTGIARKVYEADPNPALKFDYQLMYGADVLECLGADGLVLQQHTPTPTTP